MAAAGELQYERRRRILVALLLVMANYDLSHGSTGGRKDAGDDDCRVVVCVGLID